MNPHTTLFDFNSQIGYNTLKEIDMRGSIRMFAGLVVTMAAVGGIDNATDGNLLACVAIAFLGLAVMASGVSASKQM